MKKSAIAKKKWVWYKIKVNKLNLTKKRPKGGSPVKAKIKKKIKFFKGTYLWIYTIRLVVE